MKPFTLTIDGKATKVRAIKVGNTLWIHHQGECFAFEKPDSKGRRRSSSGASGTDAGEVKAPMPGKISKVLAKPGQTVEAQSVLIIMEAMKMEYTLKAGSAGVVSAVSCQEGQQVTLGQVLVVLDPHKKGSL